MYKLRFIRYMWSSHYIAVKLPKQICVVKPL
ncbi:hypothetical protein F383_32387 [Gossypium arboreum]|uniref:Uncharacterized protein n=1 Tax=Gossypium arboreum TaxID=29729 RepID=A0A0B0N4A0_GOSAR|nr:hypothetical protein F383_32387 [Gossypium arboreum]